jgi:general secretion pathway protein I
MMLRSSHRSHRGRIGRRHQGFTLMEILVAFVVLATAVAVLYRTFSTGIRNVDAISGYSEAVAIADARLLALGLEQPVVEGEESGETEDRRFKWTMTVRPYTPPGSTGDNAAAFFNANQLVRATITVTWDERGAQARTISLSTVRMIGKTQT